MFEKEEDCNFASELSEEVNVRIQNYWVRPRSMVEEIKQ